MKEFNGKAIYQPKGKAAEYSKYAVSFFCGCSVGCSYCYNKKGRFKNVLGGNIPTLKKCFKANHNALEVFEKELMENLEKLQQHGLFFSFTTDPYLPGTWVLIKLAIKRCVWNNVPVKLLTKNAISHNLMISMYNDYKNLIAFGFTLTGHDELEQNASTNAERIEAMRKLHDAGFKTWASIEPIIDFESSLEMIKQTEGFCDLYKIGLESGKKYNKKQLKDFVGAVILGTTLKRISKVYFKDSLLKTAGIKREDLPKNCVNRDFNIFESK